MRIEKIHHTFVYLPEEVSPTHVKVGEDFLPLPSPKKGKLFKRVECDTSGTPGKGEWVDIYSGNRFEKLSLDNGVSYLYNSSTRTLYDPQIHVRILPHTEAIHDMRAISKEIISLKFKNGESLRQCQKKFYDIMRKHGIRQGTAIFDEEGNRKGRAAANFEWTICKELFLHTLMSHLNFQDIFSVPSDLAE
jgi:hypothetical protein